MSARRLQRPAPIGAQVSKWIGTSIVTTLAVGPAAGGPDGNSQENSNNEAPDGSNSRRSNSIPEVFRNIMLNAYKLWSGTLRHELDDKAPILTDSFYEEETPHGSKSCEPGLMPSDFNATEAVSTNRFSKFSRFLSERNILAEFQTPQVPLFMQPKTLTGSTKFDAVLNILKVYEEGFSVEALIEKEFPHGDFPYHLAAYFRERVETYNTLQEGSLEALLVDAYITGLKEWCAAAHDLFIASAERVVRAPVGTSNPVQLKVKKNLAAHLRLKAAHRQSDVVQFLRKEVFRICPELRGQWRSYKWEHKLTHKLLPSKVMLAAGYPQPIMKKNPRFISWLLRNCSPKLFVAASAAIAEAVREGCGHSYLVNALDLMYLHEADIIEYKRWKRLLRPDMNRQEAADQVKEVDSIQTPLLSQSVPMVAEYLEDSSRILDPVKVVEDCSQRRLPPFLQLGAGIEEPDTSTVMAAVKLYSEGNVQGLSLLIKERFSEEQLHTHFFSFLRDVIRGYHFFPGRPDVYTAPTSWCPYDLEDYPGKLVSAYITGLQGWCADVHDAFKQEVEKTLRTSTRDPAARDYFETARAAQPLYTNIVNCLKGQMMPEVHEGLPPPPSRPPHVDPQISELEANLHDLNWLIRNMPWDSFLFLRLDFARAVRELDHGDRGFSFLASVLESLSFTDREADEFKEYCNKYCEQA